MRSAASPNVHEPIGNVTSMCCRLRWHRRCGGALLGRARGKMIFVPCACACHGARS